MSESPPSISRRLSVAPMMDYTDRHARFLLRLITRHTLLYTEMVTSAALMHGDAKRLLEYNEDEHPVALQLGGSDVLEMAAAAALASEYGYDEINLNVGCPSDRVQAGRFGACLMAEPGIIASCIKHMRDVTDLPLTVKTRIGIDNLDSYAALCQFVGLVAEAGCNSFTIHARKAWLKGLSPKENRDVPPLDYPRVWQLKQDFPSLEIVINGGILSLDQVLEHLGRVDGVMLGRAAYHNPWILSQADELIHGDVSSPRATREDVLSSYKAYCGRQQARGVPLSHMTRHLMGLVQGLPGAKQFRRILSEGARCPDANTSLIDAAWESIDRVGVTTETS